METKAFKKPPIPDGRKNQTSNKENVKKQVNEPPRDTPYRKHSCVPGAARSTSMSSDDSKATSSKSGQIRTVDLDSWECKAKKLMRDFCSSNGLDVQKFYVDDGKKKMAVAPKTGTAHALAQSVNKLLPIFKALDILMSEKRLPPAEVTELLKPLGDSFFIRQSAFYWHLFAKAAVASGDYNFGLELLERGTKCCAQPLMEMQRAYGSVCRQMVDVIGAFNAVPPAVTVQMDVANGSNDARDVLGESSHQELEAVNGKNGITEQTGGLNGAIGIGNTPNSTIEQGDNADGIEQENTETEGVETVEDEEKNVDEPKQSQENLAVNDVAVTQEAELGSQEAEMDLLQEENEQVEEIHPVFPKVSEDSYHTPNVLDQNTATHIGNSSDGAPMDTGTNANNNMASGAEGTEAKTAVTSQITIAIASPEPADSNDGTTNDASAGDEVPELPTLAVATPATARRGGNRQSSLDQGAIFKSSAKKLVVFENKSAKKQKGASGDVPAYHVTPVRRSTRKPGGYDKWLSYRTTEVDSPSEFSELGVDKMNAVFKKNPYLLSDSDSDD